MKWHAGYGLYAIRGVSQREPRSPSLRRRGRRRPRVEERVVEAEAALEDVSAGPRAPSCGEARGDDRAVRGPCRGGSASWRCRPRGTRTGPRPCEPAMPSALTVRLGVDAGEARGGGRRHRRCRQIAVGWKPRVVERARRRHRRRGSRPRCRRRSRRRARGPSRRAPRRLRPRPAQTTTRHVRDRVRVRVVEVERVAEHRVRERGVGGGHAVSEADHRRLASPPSSATAERPAVADAERVRGEPAAERVEQVELGGLDDLRGDVVVRRARGERGERCAAVAIGPPLRRSSPCRCPGTRRRRLRARRACRP